MDAEMKAQFDNLNSRFDNVDQRFDNLTRLVFDVKDSLDSEMRTGFASLDNKVENISIRLDRHAGLLRTGGVRIARLDDWAEKVDKSLQKKNEEIAELRERILRLEQKKSA